MLSIPILQVGIVFYGMLAVMLLSYESYFGNKSFMGRYAYATISVFDIFSVKGLIVNVF